VLAKTRCITRAFLFNVYAILCTIWWAFRCVMLWSHLVSICDD